MAATTTNTPAPNGNSTEGNTNGKRTREAPTAIEAISKIGKILDQLSPADRKRVLAFVNESNT